jgi:c-di-GMP-related signal transduction protein
MHPGRKVAKQGFNFFQLGSYFSRAALVKLSAIKQKFSSKLHNLISLLPIHQ